MEIDTNFPMESLCLETLISVEMDRGNSNRVNAKDKKFSLKEGTSKQENTSNHENQALNHGSMW